MRQFSILPACLAAALALSACAENEAEAVDRAFQDVNAIDGTDLNHVMLSAADPNEAVAYFARAAGSDPERTDLQRGLAKSLVRARRSTEAAAAFQKLVKMPGATDTDRVGLADALIRTGDWEQARSVLDSVPPTHDTFRRYRLEAMMADVNQEWDRADSFYEIAMGLTTEPAGVMNNWGYSKLTRGDYAEAERLFSDAIRNDPDLFTAKNNLVLARGAQRNYSLPVIRMVQEEKALLLHTLALSAVKQGDTRTGEALLREAIATHPRHFEEAARSLAALQNG